MLDYNSVYNGYLKASGGNPVDRKTLKRALSPYNLSFPNAHQTDAQLRALAVKTVLAKYRASRLSK